MNQITRHYPAARQEDMAEIRSFVEDSATELGAKPDTVGELVLAVNEAVINIFIHGYQDGPGDVTIELARKNSNLEVRLSDSAPAFDPTTVPPPNMNPPLEQRPAGGLGVHMMRSFVDELSYRRLPDGQNELIMVIRDAI
jgi:serine/threonine-protein kinase RsbW